MEGVLNARMWVLMLNANWPWVVTALFIPLLVSVSFLVIAVSTNQLTRPLWLAFVSTLRWIGGVGALYFALFAAALGVALIQRAWSQSGTFGLAVVGCVGLLVSSAFLIMSHCFWHLLPAAARSVREPFVSSETRATARPLAQLERFATRLQGWGQGNERN